MHSFAIVILVGTDHHGFQRAVDWADQRAAEHPDESVFIQFGRTQAPTRADGAAFLSPAEMRAAVARADVVITHGGPGTISDAKSGGHRPIVFPRDPEFGEHIDDHQQRFAAWCDRRGLVRFAKSTADLDAAVAALGPEGTREAGSDRATSDQAIAAVGALLDGELHERTVTPGAPTVVHVAAAAGATSSAVTALVRSPGVMALGHVGRLWVDGVERDRLCACGERFSACAFWSEVGDVAFGGWDAPAAATLRGALRVPSPVKWWQRGGRETREAMLAFAAPYRAIYTAARVVSGASVLVDSTPGVVGALAYDHQVDLRLLALEGAALVKLTKSRELPTSSVSLAGFVRSPEPIMTELLGERAVGLTGASSARVQHGNDARLS